MPLDLALETSDATMDNRPRQDDGKASLATAALNATHSNHDEATPRTEHAAFLQQARDIQLSSVLDRLNSLTSESPSALHGQVEDPIIIAACQHIRELQQRANENAR